MVDVQLFTILGIAIRDCSWKQVFFSTEYINGIRFAMRSVKDQCFLEDRQSFLCQKDFSVASPAFGPINDLRET